MKKWNEFLAKMKSIIAEGKRRREEETRRLQEENKKKKNESYKAQAESQAE